MIESITEGIVLRNAIQNNGWEQGLILFGENKDAILSHATEQFTWAKSSDALLLFSQDCDILHPSLDYEPFAEFFCIRTIDFLDCSIAYGKNPRRLHLCCDSSIFFEVIISHHIRIHREFLADISCTQPRIVLAEKSHTILLSWMSKRYSRPAFPDRFNDYIAKIKHIDTKLKTLNARYPFLKRIFFLVEPDREVAPDQQYKLAIQVLLDGRAPMSNTNLKCQIESEICKVFSNANIFIKDVSCVYEDEMTLYELNFYKVWDKDYITNRYGFD